ncbi:four-carbon acid sugar kinase family protein [Ruania zhangjianzhongii]|uniref:four-carbon acid sugar kinase family protein n=1 Tax=Ruania zhangjianzhongii TaxID=2603206 RepID=UPI0011CC3F1F|nr:nucleotide-binding domain containing protein [Ruania zhangjianzhongii]
MTFSLVWADDLSGAAEAADTWQQASGESIRIHLGTGDRLPTAAGAVWDLDLRHEGEVRARSRLTPALARLDQDSCVFFKLDSQLRGPVRAYAAALLATGRSVVLSAANPALGRITAEGRHHVPGAGTATALRTLFAGLPQRHLAASEYGQLPELLSASSPVLVTADVSSAAELDRLARHCRISPPAHAAGSAPFLGALAQGYTGGHGRSVSAAAEPERTPAPVRQLLAVIGSTEPAGQVQVAALRQRDPQTAVVQAPPAPDPHAIAAAARQVREALARGAHTVLTPAPEPRRAAYRSSLAMTALATTCRAAIAGVGNAVALYLSGGHTARRVLEQLGLTTLRTAPHGHGAVARLIAVDGRTVLTKPGSYGDRHTLLDLTTPAPADHTPTPDKEPPGGHT